MERKVGLAVCYDARNFGSQLQILATNYKIRELGYIPEIIRYKKIFTPIFILQTIPRLFNPYFLRSKFSNNNRKSFFKNHPEIKEGVKIRNYKFEEFAEKHFNNMSQIYKGWECLVKKSNKDYSIFLSGSDQLWLPSNLGSHFFTLEFVKKDNIKISYSTSFGVNYIPWFQKYSTKRYLNRFNYLSTREQGGKDIIEDLTNKKVELVCDPTLLLSEEEWYKVIPNKNVITEKYIFCYFLGNNEEHRIVATRLSKILGIKIVTSLFFYNSYNEFDVNFGDIQLYDLDSFDFVNLIRNAEYVLTDSFHGSVFSIINHKNFITFNRFSNSDKNSRNSRIDNLFNILSLDSRRYSGDINKVFEKIDYEKVDEKLYDFRNYSFNFLKNALDGSKEKD